MVAAHRHRCTPSCERAVHEHLIASETSEVQPITAALCTRPLRCFTVRKQRTVVDQYTAAAVLNLEAASHTCRHRLFCVALAKAAAQDATIHLQSDLVRAPVVDASHIPDQLKPSTGPSDDCTSDQAPSAAYDRSTLVTVAVAVDAEISEGCPIH